MCVTLHSVHTAACGSFFGCRIRQLQFPYDSAAGVSRKCKHTGCGPRTESHATQRLTLRFNALSTSPTFRPSPTTQHKLTHANNVYIWKKHYVCDCLCVCFCAVMLFAITMNNAHHTHLMRCMGPHVSKWNMQHMRESGVRCVSACGCVCVCEKRNSFDKINFGLASKCCTTTFNVYYTRLPTRVFYSICLRVSTS